MTDPTPSPAALHRAVKRHVWGARHAFVATCAPGVEDLLAEEVAALEGVDAVAPRAGAVAFEGPYDALAAALVRLRIAESLRLVVLAHAAAASYPMLHDHLTRVAWARWLPARAAVTVRVKTSKSRVRDAEGVERSLRQAWRAQGLDGEAADGPPMLVHVRVHRDRATVALDVGGPLHRRDGGKWVTETTLRETTAAALVRRARVAGHDLVLDPFCGSGTLLAEAHAAAVGAPTRTAEGPFAASPAWAPGRFAQALRVLDHERDGRSAPPLVGRDADPEALAVVHRNLAARVGDGVVDLAAARAQDLDLPAIARRAGARRPLLLTNPPYGRAAAAAGATPDALVGDLVAGARGWAFALLYPRPDALAERPGVRVDAVRTVVTGGLRNAMVVGHVEPGP